MSAKKWTISFLSLAFLAMVGTFSFNYIIDPLWINPYHGILEKKIYIDEREQKINYIKHRKPSYRNVILGSSRATYIHSEKLGKHWLNLACSGMYPAEMYSYLKWAKSRATYQEIDTVLIVLDFWTFAQNAIINYGSAFDYVEKTSGLYSLRSYLSLDALTYSLKTLQLNHSPEPYDVFYTWPHLQKNRIEASASLKQQKTKEQLWYYQKEVYGEKYRENEHYFEQLEALVDSFPEVHFISYSTPVTGDLRNVIDQLGKTESQELWSNNLKQLKKLNFKPMHGREMHDSLFYDAHHLKPTQATLLAKEVIGKSE